MASSNTRTPISSIAMALAGRTASVNIPRPAGTEMESVARSDSRGLPTPPNSISPNLPPRAFTKTEHDSLTPPGQVSDSDIDLQEHIEHAAAQNHSARGFDKVDATGNITPTLLATHHLPDILLEHGPLAIRYIIGFLTTSVPGFSGIPPNKARRIVVAALEGRGGQAEASGGLDGQVIFEKVGWGRWEARRRGQPSQRSRHTSPVAMRHAANSLRSPSPYSTSHSKSPYGTSNSKTFRLAHRPRDRLPSATSLSKSYSFHQHETEADGMSMDDESASSSEAEEPSAEDDIGEATDEEDWASIGAAALRSGFSFPKNGKGKIDYNRRASNHALHMAKLGAGGARSSTLAKSAPALTDAEMKDLIEGVGKDEGEAIKALLQLGSM